ncbi:MAG: DUF4623 domain-containing protein [Tepidisphaerales bacterium]
MSVQLKGAVTLAALAVAGSVASAAIPSISPLISFGGGDGWRAPLESLVGDVVAGPYPYLGTGNNERGIAYNPVTGNLILVSRNGGNNIRILDGLTGVDKGALNLGTGIVTGGTLTINMVGVADDGAIYVANLVTNVGSAPLRVYKWDNETVAAPSVFFSNTMTGFAGTPRLGDSLDVTGSGANTRVVAGGSGTTGYAVITGSGAVVVPSFSPAGPGTGDFRLGVTFAGTEFEVWGKQTGGSASAAPLRRTTYTDLGTGASVGSSILTTGGEIGVDYAVIAGVPYLATVDANSSRVRVYNMANPASPALVLDGTTLTATSTANGNATGQVKWGAISGHSAILYALNTNNGIQAFSVVVPEPAALGLLAPAALLLGRRRQTA